MPFDESRTAARADFGRAMAMAMPRCTLERHQLERGPVPTIEASVEVAAPRHVVWELLADPTRHTEFGTFVSEVVLASSAPIGPGTVYHETSGPGFMKSTSQWTITEFDPPSRIVHEGKEPSMHSQFTWTLEEVGPTATRLSQVGEFVMMPGLRALGRVLEALVGRRMLERETKWMLRDVKRIAEAQARR